MPKPFALVPLLMLLPMAAHATALPGNAAAGKKLHDGMCLSCHDDGVYKRKDRQVKSLQELTQQISACGHAAGVTLGKSQASDLAKYLNETYYKFK